MMTIHWCNDVPKYNRFPKTSKTFKYRQNQQGVSFPSPTKIYKYSKLSNRFPKTSETFKYSWYERLKMKSIRAFRASCFKNIHGTLDTVWLARVLSSELESSEVTCTWACARREWWEVTLQKQKAGRAPIHGLTTLRQRIIWADCEKGQIRPVGSKHILGASRTGPQKF